MDNTTRYCSDIGKKNYYKIIICNKEKQNFKVKIFACLKMLEA